MLSFRSVFIRTRTVIAGYRYHLAPTPHGASVNTPSSPSTSGAHLLARNVGEAPQARTSSPAYGHPSPTNDAEHPPVRRVTTKVVEIVPPRVRAGEVFVCRYNGVDALSRSAAPHIAPRTPTTTEPPKRKRWDHPRRTNARQCYVE